MPAHAAACLEHVSEPVNPSQCQVRVHFRSPVSVTVTIQAQSLSGCCLYHTVKCIPHLNAFHRRSSVRQGREGTTLFVPQALEFEAGQRNWLLQQDAVHTAAEMRLRQEVAASQAAVEAHRTNQFADWAAQEQEDALRLYQVRCIYCCFCNAMPAAGRYCSCCESVPPSWFFAVMCQIAQGGLLHAELHSSLSEACHIEAVHGA